MAELSIAERLDKSATFGCDWDQKGSLEVGSDLDSIEIGGHVLLFAPKVIQLRDFLNDWLEAYADSIENMTLEE